MKWAWGILVTSDFLRLLSKQPSRRKGRAALPHFLSPNLLQKGVICQFYCIKKVHRSIKSKQMSSFRLNMWKMPQNWCQNPLTQQTECWSPSSQWPAVGGVTFGRTMSACVHIIIPWKSLLTGTWGKQFLHSTCKTSMSWNPALEDAKEPWLKIREIKSRYIFGLIFFPLLFPH